jgi:hypothetical protein
VSVFDEPDFLAAYGDNMRRLVFIGRVFARPTALKVVVVLCSLSMTIATAQMNIASIAVDLANDDGGELHNRATNTKYQRS